MRQRRRVQRRREGARSNRCRTGGRHVLVGDVVRRAASCRRRDRRVAERGGRSGRLQSDGRRREAGDGERWDRRGRDGRVSVLWPDEDAEQVIARSIIDCFGDL